MLPPIILDPKDSFNADGDIIFTSKQKKALRKLLEKFHQEYPRALIVGHHDLDSRKACPCFDAAANYSNLQPQ